MKTLQLSILCATVLTALTYEHHHASAQQAYITSLEKTLAKCVSVGDNAIQIGDEIYMCGAARTGIKVKS